MADKRVDFDYDDNGNRETANGDTYDTDPNNQLASDDTYDYTYDAGASTATSVKDGDRLELSFSGSYSWVGNNPASANLPDSGRFSAKLTLDCSASRVITESISLFI